MRRRVRTDGGRRFFRIVTEAVFAAEPEDLSALWALFYIGAAGGRFTGKVCNGPAGTWDITMKGEIKAMGQGWTYTGGMTAKINADGTGPVSGVLNGKSGRDPRFRCVDQHRLVRRDGQTPISTGEGLPQTFTLPVDVGNSC